MCEAVRLIAVVFMLADAYRAISNVLTVSGKFSPVELGLALS